jgi:hypothetical protein
MQAQVQRPSEVDKPPNPSDAHGDPRYPRSIDTLANKDGSPALMGKREDPRRLASQSPSSIQTDSCPVQTRNMWLLALCPLSSRWPRAWQRMHRTCDGQWMHLCVAVVDASSAQEGSVLASKRP